MLIAPDSFGNSQPTTSRVATKPGYGTAGACGWDHIVPRLSLDGIPLHWAPDLQCAGRKRVHQRVFEYAEGVFDAYPELPKLSYIHLSESHSDLRFGACRARGEGARQGEAGRRNAGAGGECSRPPTR